MTSVYEVLGRVALHYLLIACMQLAAHMNGMHSAVITTDGPAGAFKSVRLPSTF